MLWVEMSRDLKHGGKGWGFGECLWAPTEKKGGGTWGYWELMRRINPGDIILHLRGKSPSAGFVGYSVADASAYITQKRPPEPGYWSYGKSFYRVPLREFTLFGKPILVKDVFSEKKEILLDYYRRHSPARSKTGRYLFYVDQAGRIQCQNGAYLSEMDPELIGIIFGEEIGTKPIPTEGTPVDVTTSQQVREMKARTGQRAFSEAVRSNYGHICSFPECEIKDEELLVGSHIARWADATHLRGKVSNGLCLCVLHDRAFELGLFTVTTDNRIRINNPRVAQIDWAKRRLVQFDGYRMRRGAVSPSKEALEYHWERIGFRPAQE